MLLKVFIIAALLLIIGSLFSALFYLMKDKGQGKRTVKALTLRISQKSEDAMLNSTFARNHPVATPTKAPATMLGQMPLPGAEGATMWTWRFLVGIVPDATAIRRAEVDDHRRMAHRRAT